MFCIFSSKKLCVLYHSLRLKIKRKFYYFRAYANVAATKSTLPASDIFRKSPQLNLAVAPRDNGGATVANRLHPHAADPIVMGHGRG